MSDETMEGMGKWREQNPTASLREMEAALDERIMKLRAKVLEEAFPNLEERHDWLAQATEDLWQGKVELVIEACRPLAKKSKWAKQALTYYGNNMQRMRHDQFWASGLLIGSDIIESGCKQIVAQCLKLPGVQRNLDGAILTAKARTT